MKRIDTYSSDGSLEYLDWTRGLTMCAICLEERPIEPFHVIHVGRGARKDKPDPRHRTAIPADRICHSMYHFSPKQFWKNHPKLDLWKEVFMYNLLYEQTRVIPPKDMRRP